jgi:uroporphyrinogen-III synthase
VRLLITRPQPDAERTAAALRARGHVPIVAPLFNIETVGQADPAAGPWAALLLTSANGLRGLGGMAQHSVAGAVPIFAVGDRTAQAARDAGFATVHSAAGAAGDLAALVAAQLTPPARLLYLAGEDRAGDLDDALRTQGFAVDLIVAYRAVAVETLPAAAAAALGGGVDGVLHFSRRSAAAYLNAARRSGLLVKALTPIHYCLSARMAEPLRDAGTVTLRIAAEPSEPALLALIGAP